MNRLSVKLLSIIAVFFFLESSVIAEDLKSIVEDIQGGQISIDPIDAPLLLPFAVEWDSQASKTTNGGPVGLTPYRNLAEPNEDLLKASIEALAKNENAIRFFSSQETQEAFDEAYTRARNNGSSVGLIPHSQAARYWLLSQTIAAGPETLAAYPNGPSAQWCLPPLIRCTPPTPVPTNQ